MNGGDDETRTRDLCRDSKKWTLPQSGRSLNLGLARKFDPLFHEALECCFNSHRPVQLITGQIRTKDHVRGADQPQFVPINQHKRFVHTNPTGYEPRYVNRWP